MGLEMPAQRRAFRQACSTAWVVIGWPKYPRKSHSFGRLIRQYSRSVSRRREHDVAVLAALAFGHLDHHPLVVERGGLQTNGFGDAQAGGIADRQDRLVLDVFDAAEKMENLGSAENDRQLF